MNKLIWVLVAALVGLLGPGEAIVVDVVFMDVAGEAVGTDVVVDTTAALSKHFNLRLLLQSNGP